MSTILRLYSKCSFYQYHANCNVNEKKREKKGMLMNLSMLYAIQARRMQEKGWQPRWFKKDSEDDCFQYIGGYWEERERAKKMGWNSGYFQATQHPNQCRVKPLELCLHISYSSPYCIVLILIRELCCIPATCFASLFSTLVLGRLIFEFCYF